MFDFGHRGLIGWYDHFHTEYAWTIGPFFKVCYNQFAVMSWYRAWQTYNYLIANKDYGQNYKPPIVSYEPQAGDLYSPRWSLYWLACYLLTPYWILLALFIWQTLVTGPARLVDSRWCVHRGRSAFIEIPECLWSQTPQIIHPQLWLRVYVEVYINRNSSGVLVSKVACY